MVPKRGRRPHAAKATSPNAGITFEVTGFAAITLYDLERSKVKVRLRKIITVKQRNYEMVHYLVNAMDVFFTRGMLCKGGRADARIINGLNLYTGLVPLSAICILLTCCLCMIIKRINILSFSIRKLLKEAISG